MESELVTGIGKDVVVGFSSVFDAWVAAILIASSRMVWSNWRTFVGWRHQDRDTRLRMALWMSIPLLMAGLLWMRTVALFRDFMIDGVMLIHLIQVFVYMPIILTALALILWWVCSRTFRGDDLADRMWLILMALGMTLGVFTTAISYIF